MDYEKLGQRIKEIRKQRNMSQQELSYAARISPFESVQRLLMLFTILSICTVWLFTTRAWYFSFSSFSGSDGET